MFRNSLIREMSFKLNFLLWMLVEVLWFAGQLVFIQVVFSYVGTIGDWSKWEVVLLIGTHQLIGQLFQAFFYMNLANLPELVRTGRMDFMLLLPVDTQFMVSLKQFAWIMSSTPSLERASSRLPSGNSPLSNGVTASALYRRHLLRHSHSLQYPADLFCLELLDGTLQGLIYGYYSLFNIGRYPDTIYRGLFKLVFSWLIPVIIVANIPARLLIHAAENPWPTLLQLSAATLFMVGATRLLWNAALRRYSSASS